MKNIFASAVVAVLASFGTLHFMGGSGGEGTVATQKETAYERVMRTGKIRCGYVIYPPALNKTPEGEMVGIYADIANEMADMLSLEIEWSEEVSWATLAEGLKTERYDLFCSAAWPNAGRARIIDFSQPVYYSVIDAYVRQNENRFTSLEQLNRPEIKFSTVEGATIHFMTQKHFPNASIHALPEMSSHAEMILDVALNKADAVVAERVIANDFMKHNPDKLKRVVNNFPVVVNPNTLPYKKGEVEFGAMINSALLIMNNQGDINRILEKHEEGGDLFYRPAKPYEVKQPFLKEAI